MSKQSQAKRKGADTEIWAVQREWTAGLDAEHIRKAGEKDQGDHWVRLPSGLQVVQVKAVRNLSLTATLKAVAKQAAEFAQARDLAKVPPCHVLVRPYGLGRARIDEWPIVQTFGQFLGEG